MTTFRRFVDNKRLRYSQQIEIVSTTFRRVFDANEVKSILRHPDICSGIVSDPQDIEKITDDTTREIFFYVTYSPHGSPFGIILFNRHQDGKVFVDVGIRKGKRGRMAIIAAMEVINYFCKSMNCDTLFAKIRKNNRPSFVVAKLAGFTKISEDEISNYMEYRPWAIK